MPVPGPLLQRAQHAAHPGPLSFADIPTTGSLLVGTGTASVARIPIPGTNGLCIELWPRGRVPASGSTSTLFFQDITGRRHLRLDYGFNVRTNSIDYHWNQASTHANFGISDHAPAGRAGALAHRAARYFRYAGRLALVAAVVADLTSPLGTAVGGIGGCIVGGAAAYYGGSVLAGEVFDRAEGTLFTPLPEAPPP